MYIKILFGEVPSGGMSVTDTKEVLVNPHCPIRVIYEFIRKTFKIGNEYELDLCDENGNLVFMYEKDNEVYGDNFFVAKATYYLVLFEKDEDNRVTNPLLFLPESSKKSSAQWNDLMGKIRRQLNPNISKTSKMIRTRSTTSQAK